MEKTKIARGYYKQNSLCTLRILIYFFNLITYIQSINVYDFIIVLFISFAFIFNVKRGIVLESRCGIAVEIMMRYVFG